MRRGVSMVVATLAVTVFVSSAGAQSGGGYELTRSSLEPGGVTSGAGYEARGTLGQPDAGSASGGGYTVTGGFSAGVAPGEPGVIPTVTEWGLIIMTLAGLMVGTIIFGRRRAARA